MRITSLAAAVAGMALVAAPVSASAATASNPAMSLSVAGPTRAVTNGDHASALGGGGAGIYALLIIVGIIAIGVIAGTNDDSPDSP